MPVIVVSGSESAAGVTTVAVGLAHRLAYAGHEVHLERLAFGANAERDAATFGSLDFAASSGSPVHAGAVPAAGGSRLSTPPFLRTPPAWRSSWAPRVSRSRATRTGPVPPRSRAS